ncbi:hypothetical protein MNBD_PLANCTO03-130 [hydrothermal vent metagenome]|uniref:Uncharacterized protein n=1 Tax=hydrothermal vent metagenome TaxID=652676 RepID=A0A3B1DQR2_9ZZZZ
MNRALFLTIVVGVAASFASAQSRTGGECNLVIPESTNDRVMLFNSFDGSLINNNFIDLVPAGGMTPINAVQVGEEIWVSDQIADSIFRYSLDGSTHLGTITGGLDNIRGIEWVGDTVYVTNSGTNNNAPGDGVVTIDVGTQTINGFFVTGSDGAGDPFDVLDYFGNLLVNDIIGNDIDTFTRDGDFVSAFHESDGSTGINFPEQMSRTSMGNILIGGFSSPSGIYEYDNAGNQINYWDVGSSVRGVHELGNGNILFTDSSGVYVLDPNSGAITASITGVSARFAECVIPAPGTLGLMGLAGLAAFRRRR